MHKITSALLAAILFAGCSQEHQQVAFSASEAIARDGDSTRQRAINGDLNSRYLVVLADYWEQGKYDEALPFLKDLANEGSVGAAHHLAYIYGSGQGVKQNIEESAEWLARAAELGSESAARDLRRYNSGTSN